ncbi:MAG: DUF1553 domain-containing protein [Planctomycetaceae bacterium]|nr:DUF1553 domain-containing protein [Planctomycetaceae bacterium]
MNSTRTAFLAIVWFGMSVACADDAIHVVTPTTVTLHGQFSRAQLLVRAGDSDERQTPDLTHAAAYTTSDPAIVSVDDHGRLLAVGNGPATVSVAIGNRVQAVLVNVAGIDPSLPPDFDGSVQPLLSRYGCNAGACHASQFGKGGMILSVMGYDPSMDHAALVRDRTGRRINVLEPEQSLLLKKPTMQVAHGGGLRLKKSSPDYDLLVEWIRGGAPGPRAEAPRVTGLDVTPARRLAQPDETQQLQVIARYSDGSSRDVTCWARFDSLDDAVLNVDPAGLVTVAGRGQAPVMVRFQGQASIALFSVPYGPAPQLTGWQNNNFIDEHAERKFRELGIEPSPLCDDATFLRRAWLDAIGTLPSPEAATAFLNDADPQKRTRLIDRLLGLTGDPLLDVHNDAYAAWWTLKWSDLLRNTSDGQATDEQRMWAMHNWLKDGLRTNRPLDQMVRELITAKGSIFSSGPASYYRIFNNSSDLAEATAQLFLGVRLQCAKCHHHPFEKYAQDDYYSFAAFFARVGNKSSEEFGLFGGEQVVMVRSGGEVGHPKTGAILPPRPLEGQPVDHPIDRRIPLATWLTAADNPFFARSIANRYTDYLLGRGLVEPVDDLRATNPATNPELLDALAAHFTGSGFDLKQLIRAIMTSRLYQLDSQPTESNASDEKFYSHYKVKRLPAEPLLDAIDAVTGVQTKFKSLPLGTRAVELPDAEYPDYFLNVFGKPRRVSVCECERAPDENLVQALHTLNGDTIATKSADAKGRIAQLIAAGKTDDEITSELYLRGLSRPPTDAELAAAREFLTLSANRQEIFEDILWALLNSKDFLFVH